MKLLRSDVGDMSKQRDGMMLSDLAKIFPCTGSAEVLPDNQPLEPRRQGKVKGVI